MDVHYYQLVDADGHEQDEMYEDPREAIEAARKQGCAVIRLVFEYADSELLWTPNNANTWP